MKRPLDLLLVDDHAMVREMLMRQINSEGDMHVAVDASAMDEAIERSRGVPLDLAVLDVEMPGMSVFEGVARLREDHPGLRVMFLSGSISDTNIQRALDVQASGYTCKCEPLPALLKAIRHVAHGAPYFSPQVRERVFVARENEHTTATKLESLTRREREVLGHIAQGLSKKEIAKETGTSVKTVDQHCSNIMAKLDIHDRVMLARFALREGISTL